MWLLMRFERLLRRSELHLRGFVWLPREFERFLKMSEKLKGSGRLLRMFDKPLRVSKKV